jgi:hypothetical protein
MRRMKTDFPQIPAKIRTLAIEIYGRMTTSSMHPEANNNKKDFTQHTAVECMFFFSFPFLALRILAKGELRTMTSLTFIPPCFIINPICREQINNTADQPNKRVPKTHQDLQPHLFALLVQRQWLFFLLLPLPSHFPGHEYLCIPTFAASIIIVPPATSRAR